MCNKNTQIWIFNTTNYSKKVISLLLSASLSPNTPFYFAHKNFITLCWIHTLKFIKKQAIYWLNHLNELVPFYCSTFLRLHSHHLLLSYFSPQLKLTSLSTMHTHLASARWPLKYDDKLREKINTHVYFPVAIFLPYVLPLILTVTNLYR